jgi:hypothetical protein
MANDVQTNQLRHGAWCADYTARHHADAGGAVRSGLGNAAHMADAIARDLIREHTVRGQVTKLGNAMALVAKRCGDAIWDMCDAVQVDAEAELQAALTLLRAAGYVVVPTGAAEAPAAAVEPLGVSLGQTWASPNPAITPRTIVAIANDPFGSWGGSYVHYAMPGCADMRVGISAWNAWVRRADARVVTP